MAAGHFHQLSLCALRGRLAVLRPLGLLLPAQPRPFLLGVRQAGGDSSLEGNRFYEKYQHKIQELRK